jgi:hypothetical protein
MTKFRDANGTEWNVALNAATIRQIREQCGIDPLSEDGFLRLFDDDVLLVEVMAIVCSEEQASRRVPVADFMNGIIGDAIDNARTALQSATIDFCPARKRDIFRDMLVKLNEVRKEAYANVARIIADPEFEKSLILEINQKTDAAFSDLLARAR